MEREISAVTWLAVSLISLSIVIGIVMLTVGIGNNAKNQAIEYGADLSYDMDTGEIRDMRDTATDMSIAAIYSILTRNYKNIKQLDVRNITMMDDSSKASTINELDNISSDLADKVISGATSYKANSNGYWTAGGTNDASATGYVMIYEVLTDKTSEIKGLTGRAYVVTSQIDSGTWKVTILKYKD